MLLVKHETRDKQWVAAIAGVESKDFEVVTTDYLLRLFHPDRVDDMGFFEKRFVLSHLGMTAAEIDELSREPEAMDAEVAARLASYRESSPRALVYGSETERAAYAAGGEGPKRLRTLLASKAINPAFINPSEAGFTAGQLVAVRRRMNQ